MFVYIFSVYLVVTITIVSNNKMSSKNSPTSYRNYAVDDLHLPTSGQSVCRKDNQKRTSESLVVNYCQQKVELYHVLGNSRDGFTTPMNDLRVKSAKIGVVFNITS